MNDFKEALRKLRLSDGSLIKLLKGFEPEYSEDKSTLIISINDKNEQLAVHTIISLLDRSVGFETPIMNSKACSTIITEASALIKKLENMNVVLKPDILKAAKFLGEHIQKTEMEVSYGLVHTIDNYIPYRRPILTIAGLTKTEGHDFLAICKECKISVHNREQIQNLNSQNNFYQFTGDSCLIKLYDDDARKLGKKLHSLELKFNGNELLSVARLRN